MQIQVVWCCALEADDLCVIKLQPLKDTITEIVYEGKGIPVKMKSA